MLKPEPSSSPEDQGPEAPPERVDAPATIEAFLGSKEVSRSMSANLRSTLRQAERIAGVPVGDWNGDHALLVKQTFIGGSEELGIEPGRGRTPVTKWERVRSFYKWALSNHRLRDDPTEGIEMPHREDPEMPVMAIEDYKKLMDWIREQAAEGSRSKVPGQHMTPSRREAYKKMYMVLYLLPRLVSRGGEIIADRGGEPKTICSCSGERCASYPPHDFKFLPNHDVSMRVKGEGGRKRSKARFKTINLTPEEEGYLRSVLSVRPFSMHYLNERLKEYQAFVGIVLVDRLGNRVPEARLASHTFRRMVITKMVSDKQSVVTINQAAGWSEKSTQVHRYGRQTPRHISDAIRGALSAKRKRPSPQDEADEAVQPVSG